MFGLNQIKITCFKEMADQVQSIRKGYADEITKKQEMLLTAVKWFNIFHGIDKKFEPELDFEQSDESDDDSDEQEDHGHGKKQESAKRPFNSYLKDFMSKHVIAPNPKLNFSLLYKRDVLFTKNPVTWIKYDTLGYMCLTRFEFEINLFVKNYNAGLHNDDAFVDSDYIIPTDFVTNFVQPCNLKKLRISQDLWRMNFYANYKNGIIIPMKKNLKRLNTISRKLSSHCTLSIYPHDHYFRIYNVNELNCKQFQVLLNFPFIETPKGSLRVTMDC